MRMTGEIGDAANSSQAQAAAIVVENGDKDLLERSATKIQAAFRGHLARKSLKEQGRLPSTRTLPADQMDGMDYMISENQQQHQQPSSPARSNGSGDAYENGHAVMQVTAPDHYYRQQHLGTDDSGGGSGGGGSGSGGSGNNNNTSQQQFASSSTTTSTATVFNDEALR